MLGDGIKVYGVGLGIAIKYNGSTGGMDVIQKMISKFFKVPLSSAIYASDGIVVFVSGFMFNPFGYNIEMFICGIVCVIVVAYIVDFIDTNTNMVTGLRTIGNGTYYFYPDGSMAIGNATINGITHYFDGNGKMVY